MPADKTCQLMQAGYQAAAFFRIAVRHIDHFLSDVPGNPLAMTVGKTHGSAQ
jgi:hypothetical protein